MEIKKDSNLNESFLLPSILEVSMAYTNSLCGKAKGTWNIPSPDYYQTSYGELFHTFLVTRSDLKIIEESPYKPERIIFSIGRPLASSSTNLSI